MSLLDNTQMALEAAMSGAITRQTLLTNDLANADTPGFQPQDVNFQQTLRQAFAQGVAPQSVSFTPFTEQQATSTNGNGVNPDLTSAQIAENGLLYQDLTQIAAARESILKSAMNATSIA
jgi:flagellar basal-body rod protein FlgB